MKFRLVRLKLAVLGLLLSCPVFSASLDCNNVTNQIEQEICDDRKSFKLDSQLSNLFNQLHLYSTDQQQPVLRQQQLAWLKLRNEQCQLASNTRLCLRDVYQQRLGELNAKAGFMSNDMEQAEPRLLRFLKSSKIFDMLEYPKYYKINQKQFVVAIDWDQSGKIGHGLYYVDLKTDELERIFSGLPQFDGIYQDQNRMVVVIRAAVSKSGLVNETISAVVINNGVYSKHKIIEVNYYQPHRDNNDICYDAMSASSQGRLAEISSIQQLKITDVDNDGFRDVTVNIDRKNCSNGQIENKIFGLVSAAEIIALESTPIAPKPDIAKPDVAKPDVAKPDVAKPDVAKPDIAKPDIAKPDVAKPDVAKPDVAKPDVAKPDVAKPDVAKSDIAKSDVAKSDARNLTLPVLEAILSEVDLKKPKIELLQ
ncbi:lysozyme inhibitor LprI family protein [Pelagibaculum spongiae]|uniref:Lysozyme inhibitor LprI-like N-terminal domain-containing protein n=1 Tax=Pelagibaculum spongiae TaxID=2080658 RepID=A0A2V1H055_9GAMM|nr:lysozyme inhibitor LprI family protein [Pelagibaculum spongiae]PVZ70574.1 hypothetical protein DC094_08310 [Pelagibaculum spongiae]